MVDASELPRAAARAVPLNARGRVPDGTHPGPESAERAERAGRKLDRWRAQTPFDRDGWFERRLAADGLDPDALRALLAEHPDALADRLGPAPWAERLAAVFATASSHRQAPLDLPEDHAFARLVAPLLADARDRLCAGIAALDAPALGTPEELTALALPALTAAVHGMAVRTVITELHVARLTGELTGDTPEQRYRDFLDRLTRPERALRLLTEYPVLAHRLTTAAERWTTTGLTLIRRLATDLPALSAAFADGRPLGRLTELATGLGDPHRGGATVSSLRFEHGTRIVYKPRPLGAETHFQQVLRWLNPKLRLPLHDLAHLAGDGYGWVAHVTAEPARDDAELSAFYHRAGTLAALMYVLDAVDCHAQNLLAVRDQPVLIDLEALLHPDLHEPAKDLSESERLARHRARHSVLRSGLLPERMWDEGNGGTDLSALGWDPASLPPRAAPVLVNQGTDELRLEYRRVPVEAPGSRPVPAGQPLRLADHLGELEDGFTEAYRLLAADKDQLRELLGAFAGDETRMLRRDTFEYRSLLNTACHPDLLRDALDQDRHLDRLWALAAWEEHALAFVDHERADLWRGDVPVFTIRPDGVDARSSTGALIPGVADRPALELALAKADDLGEEDLARQLQLLRLSVTTADGAREPRRAVTSVVHNEPAEPAEELATRALAKAVEAGEQLVREAYRGSADLAWVGPNWAPPGRWAPAELGPDLYSGTAGITLFLHQLATVTGDRSHRSAAQAAEVTLRQQIRRRTDRLGGGLAGTGGVLYALAHLASHHPDAELDALAAQVIDRVAATAAEDTLHDLLAGNAGTIGGLLAWDTVRPGPAVSAALAACARRLTETAAPHPEGGTGWLPASLADTATRPLAGFAHGGSGIAWALARAGHRLGDDQLAQLALAALEYERTLFDPAAANWRDVREDGGPDAPSFPTLWCHGASGIALARLELAELLPEGDELLRKERDTALDTVHREGFGLNFSLCHGDLGNLEPLHLAGRPWHAQARATLDALDTNGWICGLPHGVHSPSLMTGLAGIGHGLLRLAAPDTVPSLLALHPPTAA
ncbi:type 2 lantipeptide synthetase LanM family protein [Kitasatospora aureofaciens]|uniref:type 2 lanthipeptide synthetase LanM family protein n=1 Tax=Kitasatospora aureofaciens TaxID=1894 RepID=UPI001C45F9A5|nr:type 2 lanthipeptide synthetase LanM family protein [Kitasatospora aureofaciens]MBV6695777.1 type 2 lantipeptide synthetase LanM family protein [Kitasatospora aureofaciens]